MNREKFVQALAKDSRIGTAARAEDALSAVEDTIKAALGLGRVVGLQRFGTFWVGDRPARTITKSDGTVRRFPACKGISFRPDKELRDIANTPRAEQPRAAS